MDSRKGILAKLLEQGIRILFIKECERIGHLKINLIATSIQIIKGEVQKINIFAKDIDYKYLLFDEVELEATKIKINLNITTRELKFKNNPIVKFKITFSETSLKKILLSKNWNNIGNMISEKILRDGRLKDIKIRNNQLLLKALGSKNIEHIFIETENGKVYLVNKKFNKNIQIPIEDKIYIEKVNIKNNLINILANSSISF